MFNILKELNNIMEKQITKTVWACDVCEECSTYNGYPCDLCKKEFCNACGHVALLKPGVHICKEHTVEEVSNHTI